MLRSLLMALAFAPALLARSVSDGCPAAVLEPLGLADVVPPKFHEVERVLMARAALMAYNAGPNKIAALRKDGETLEAYRGYVRGVKRDRDAFRAVETAVAIAAR